MGEMAGPIITIPMRQFLDVAQQAGFFGNKI